jgi:hypothetical protein
MSWATGLSAGSLIEELWPYNVAGWIQGARVRGRQHQNRELFDAYQRQIAACDAAIEAHFHTLAAHAPRLACNPSHRLVQAVSPPPGKRPTPLPANL